MEQWLTRWMLNQVVKAAGQCCQSGRSAVLSNKKNSDNTTLPAKVEGLIYLGDHVRCRMNVAGDDQFIVKVPNNAGEIDYRVGDNIFVGWQANDCRALELAGIWLTLVITKFAQLNYLKRRNQCSLVGNKFRKGRSDVKN